MEPCLLISQSAWSTHFLAGGPRCPATDNECELKRADKAQHAFSSDRTPTLDNAIPALEELRDAWRSRSKSPKYAAFRPALEAALAKLAKYYDLTDNSDAYLVAMCM